MFQAEGLVAYGGARLWRRGTWTSLVPLIAGCLLATATRPYAGWFLGASAAVLALHAGLRRNSASSSLVLSAVCVALIIAFIPTVWSKSSDENLKGLQISQNANARDTRSNLSLERVDYSTRQKIILNLPKRILDIGTRPYPWQLQNVSQQMGAFGTLFMWGILALLIVTISQRGGQLLTRAGPLIYPALFLLVAYALSAGNAGTAFRYRTHVVMFVIAIVVVLRYDRAAQAADDERQTPVDGLQPVLARASVPTLAR
jgi:hypothetical protein